MSGILDELIIFFEEDDWRFDQLNELPALHTVFSGENGKWQCYAHARDDTSQCVFYSVLPVSVPPNKLTAAAEFIIRANYGMMIGNFEMNYEDGEVRYKTSIDVTGDQINFALVKQLVYANCATMDHYLPGLMSVIYTNTTAVEAIAKIENQQP